MRIIDADELLQKMQTEYDSTDRLIDQGELHLDTLAEGYTEVHMLIEDCPTIDPESLIPHGRWENIPLNMDQSYFAYRWNLRKRCSVCEYAMPQEWPDFSICPNCGAKMDKEG